MPYSDVDTFLTRIDARWIADLTSSVDGSTVESPANRQRIAAAIADASALLDEAMTPIATELRPGPDALRVHAHAVAMYLLTLNRPGSEWEQIRKARDDAFAAIAALAASQATGGAAAPIEATTCAPERVFSDSKLVGFIP